MLSQLTELFESKPSEKNKEMHRLFKDLPETEKIIDDYSCALAKEILIQGRLYVTQNWLCFYSNIFTIENKLVIPFAQVTAVTKERTALVIPNAITISVNNTKYGFSSFVARDIVHTVLMLIWQNSRASTPLTTVELFTSVRKAWGFHLQPVNSEEEVWGNWKKNKPNSNQQREGFLLSSSVEFKPEEIIVQNSPDLIPTVSAETTPFIDSESISLTEQAFHTPEENSSTELSHSVDRVSTTSGDSRQSEVDVSGFYTDLETTQIEKKYPYPCGRIFNLLFQEGEFMNGVLINRKASECEFTTWEPNAMGSKQRNVRYRLALNYTIGPSSCINTEEQIMSPATQQNTVYLIDVLVKNYNIPFCDNFHVITRYLLVRTGKNETFVKVTAKIIFTKISLLTPKSFIQKNVLDGLSVYFATLEAALTNWIEKYPCETQRSNGRSRRRKRENRVVPLTPITSEPEETIALLSTPVKELTALQTMHGKTTLTCTASTNTNTLYMEKYKYYITAGIVFFLILIVYLLLFRGSAQVREPDPSAFNWPTNQKEWIHFVLKQQRAYENNFAAIKQYFKIVQDKLEDTISAIEQLNKVTDGALMKDAISCITNPSCSEEELKSISNLQEKKPPATE